jgi:hypothetical protein
MSARDIESCENNGELKNFSWLLSGWGLLRLQQSRLENSNSQYFPDNKEAGNILVTKKSIYIILRWGRRRLRLLLPIECLG